MQSLNEEMYRYVEEERFKYGSKLSAAVKEFRGDVLRMELSSIKFILQFLSRADLEHFKQGFDSGKLAHIFEDALKTHLKRKYSIDNIKVLITMPNPDELQTIERNFGVDKHKSREYVMNNYVDYIFVIGVMSSLFLKYPTQYAYYICCTVYNTLY